MFKNKALLPIAVVIFIDLLGFTIILPLLPFYATSFGASPETIGYLVASYSVCQFFAGPVLGGLSDRFGRRPLLIYSQLGSMAGFILLAFANSLPILFLSRIIDGISGGNVTIASAYIADVTEPKERSGAMAIIGIGFGMGFVVGMPLGGMLAQHYGYAVPAFVAAGFALSSTLLSTFYLKEHHHVRDDSVIFGWHYYTRIFEYLRIPNLRTLLLTFLFFVLPFSLFMSMFSLFAMLKLQFTPEDIGLFMGFVGVLGVLWQGGVIRPLVRKLGELTCLRIGLAAMVVGLLGLAVAQTIPVLASVAVLLSFGTGITRPTISSLITQYAPPTRKGGALGVSSSLESFSRAITPILGGWIIGGLHPNYIGYIGALMAAVAVFFSMRVHYDSRDLAKATP
ncbi:MAG: MFS transporter [Bacteroidota bacterium]|nr:MFS transporter [Bacteroidota bacterium]MDP4232191.1 MFS transporter [Bacteroidota bacterium]MDP4243628.1 MFS transporter [Bacteroidota bacterium]MDP4288718.1 MFS transporter [Bacteroidota bacterium]